MVSESSVLFRKYEKPLFKIRVIPENVKTKLGTPLEKPKEIKVELREDQYSTLEKISLISGLSLPDYVLLLILLELNTLVSSEEEKRRIMIEAGDDPDELDNPSESEASHSG